MFNIGGDYIVFLLVCCLPILALHWVLFPKLLAANLTDMLISSTVMTVWFSILDIWAVRCGVWHFPKGFLVSVFIDVLPIEEPVFYFVTSMLVVQTLVLLQPFVEKRLAKKS